MSVFSVNRWSVFCILEQNQFVLYLSFFLSNVILQSFIHNQKENFEEGICYTNTSVVIGIKFITFLIHRCCQIFTPMFWELSFFSLLANFITSKYLLFLLTHLFSQYCFIFSLNLSMSSQYLVDLRTFL